MCFISVYFLFIHNYGISLKFCSTEIEGFFVSVASRLFHFCSFTKLLINELKQIDMSRTKLESCGRNVMDAWKSGAPLNIRALEIFEFENLTKKETPKSSEIWNRNARKIAKFSHSLYGTKIDNLKEFSFPYSTSFSSPPFSIISIKSNILCALPHTCMYPTTNIIYIFWQ